MTCKGIIFDMDGTLLDSMGYWNRIRKDFPEVFERRAREERAIGHSCIKGHFLDELDPNAGNFDTEVLPMCSFDCAGVIDGDGDAD